MFVRFASVLALVLATTLPAQATDYTRPGISKAWALVRVLLVANPAAITDS